MRRHIAVAALVALTLSIQATPGGASHDAEGPHDFAIGGGMPAHGRTVHFNATRTPQGLKGEIYIAFGGVPGDRGYVRAEVTCLKVAADQAVQVFTPPSFDPESVSGDVASILGEITQVSPGSPSQPGDLVEIEALDRGTNPGRQSDDPIQYNGIFPNDPPPDCNPPGQFDRGRYAAGNVTVHVADE